MASSRWIELFLLCPQMSGVSSGVLTAVMRAAYGMPTRHARKDLRQLQHVAHALGADALEHEAATSLLSGTEAMSTVHAFAHAAAEGDLEGARAHLLAMCKDGTATLASWDVLDLEPEVRLCIAPRLRTRCRQNRPWAARHSRRSECRCRLRSRWALAVPRPSPGPVTVLSCFPATPRDCGGFHPVPQGPSPCPRITRPPLADHAVLPSHFAAVRRAHLPRRAHTRAPRQPEPGDAGV